MDFLFVIIVLIISVVIHEVSHGFMALVLGDVTAKYQNRLNLNPLNHLEFFGSFLLPLFGYLLGGFIIGWAKPVPVNIYNLNSEKFGIPNKFAEALVAIAGPLSNTFIAIVFSILIRILQFQNFLSLNMLNLLSIVVIMNITLAVFNLMPIPPLDGSKIFFSVLPYKFYWIREWFDKFGFFFVLFFIFFVWQFIAKLIPYIYGVLVGA